MNDDLIQRRNAATIPDYDAGLMNDWGGGNVEWWHDYLRAEIGRANDHWSDAIAALPAAQVAVPALDVEKLVEALRFYANKPLDGYDTYVADYGLRIEVGEIITDAGERARAALSAWEKSNG